MSADNIFQISPDIVKKICTNDITSDIIYKITDSRGIVLWGKQTYVPYSKKFTKSTTIDIPYTLKYYVNVTGAMGGGACCYSGTCDSMKIASWGGGCASIEVSAKIAKGSYRFVSGTPGTCNNNLISLKSSSCDYNGTDGGTTRFDCLGISVDGGSSALAVNDYTSRQPYERSHGGNGAATPTYDSNKCTLISRSAGTDGSCLSAYSNHVWEGWALMQSDTAPGTIYISAINEDTDIIANLDKNTIDDLDAQENAILEVKDHEKSMKILNNTVNDIVINFLRIYNKYNGKGVTPVVSSDLSTLSKISSSMTTYVNQLNDLI